MEKDTRANNDSKSKAAGKDSCLDSIHRKQTEGIFCLHCQQMLMRKAYGLKP